MNFIQIGARRIGPDQPCFVIAEAGVNHNGSLDLALQLVEAAHAAGADAIKFQLFRAEEQVSRMALTAGYQRANTQATSMLAMAQTYDLPWEAHRTLARRCQEIGVTYLASCFDKLAVDFFLELGGAAIKVGSGELTNYPLLAYMATTSKPILLSTGMATLSEVAAAVEHIRGHGDSPLLLFQCTSNYPAEISTANVRALHTLATAFDVPVGFSDHTQGNVAAIAATALGASMIEKHFTLDKTLAGPDHAMSLDPAGLADYVTAIRAAAAAMGDGRKEPHATEMDNRALVRRSLVAAQDIQAGDRLNEDNVTLKRPATGIDPRLWEAVHGRATRIDIPFDTPIQWEMLV